MCSQRRAPGLLRHGRGSVALLCQKPLVTTNVVRHASMSSPDNVSSLHSHNYLPASQALLAGQSPSAPLPLGGGTGTAHVAGLTFTLPPLCIWGASLHSQSSEEGQERIRRHAAFSASSSRYAGIWLPIEAYLADLYASTLLGTERKYSSRSPSATAAAAVAPPVCVALRLFPDLTVAQLPTTFVQGSANTKAAKMSEEGKFLSGSARSSRHRSRRPAAPHEQLLEAILATREPWGSGADPLQVFRHAIEGLREIGQRLLPKMPLVLQLPTRLLVSQSFLEELAKLLVRSGWRSVAFELPSTHQLYCPPLVHLTDSNWNRSGNGGSMASRWAGEGSQLPSPYHNGAVESAWCRLPVLTTPWQELCRHPTLGYSLRRLHRHDLVPFHVLFSWSLTEAKLFDDLEHSVVVDVTAPMPGSATALAKQLSLRSVGVPAEEAHRSFRQAHSTVTQDNSSASEGAEEEEEELEREIVAVSPKHRVFMNENPTASRGAGVALSSGVADTLRRHQSTKSVIPFFASSSKTVLDGAAAAWRRAKETKRSIKVNAVSVPLNNGDAAPLILDAPPDHVRVLIQKSIVKDDTALAGTTSSLTQRQRLLRKVGQFLQHTLQHDAAESATSSEGDVSTAAKSTNAEEVLEKEAAELEELLRHANAASDDAAGACAGVEDMMAEMQRYMRTHAPHSGQTRLPISTPGAAGSSDVFSEERKSSETVQAVTTLDLPRRNPWMQCIGYWSCVKVLLSNVTHAKFIWTLPTYNVSAIQRWTEAYNSTCNSRKKQSKTETAISASPLPVVPVWMPLQSVMHTEVERLLREGHQYPRPPQQQKERSGTALPTDDCFTWLPQQLNAALQDALERLPAEVRTCERRRLLRDYRVLREEGAQGAQRGGCEIRCDAAAGAERADTAEGATSDPFGAPSFLDGFGGSEVYSSAATGRNSEGEASGEIRIRVRRGVYPFHLLTPLQVEKVESEEARRLAGEAAKWAAAVDADANDCATALTADVREVNDVFKSKLAAYYSSTDFAQQQSAASLYVPSPGLDAKTLRRSWYSIL